MAASKDVEKGVELHHKELGTVIEVPADQVDAFKAAGYTATRTTSKASDK